MRIAIITDAWEPQVNGVVNTIKATVKTLRSLDHEVILLTPKDFRSFPCPTYPEIRLAWRPYRRVCEELDAFKPDCIHIATEGPMGIAARRYCVKNGLDFTTAYHTRFPEYVRARVWIPLSVSYRFLRWFHGPSKAMMVPTLRVREVLEQWGFTNVQMWSRGVDTAHFTPGTPIETDIKRPLYIYVGRLAVEKNINAFLDLDLPGSKWLVGDGPDRAELEKRHPEVRFWGAKAHYDLPPYYNCADAFVFPSLTDTFGLVLIEAMACGVPVAAFPVEGPIDVVADGVSGSLNQDLKLACEQALKMDREAVRKHALSYSWETATQQFLNNLHPVRSRTVGDASSTPATGLAG